MLTLTLDVAKLNLMKRESGQALVLVLLSLSVVLTIVLYVVSRSVTDIAVSTHQEESVRAFSAAEAGVEKVLVTSSSTGLTAIGDANYDANVTDFAEGTKFFNYPIQLSSGDSMTIWFMAHDASGNLTSSGAFTGNQMKVCWGKPNTPSDLYTPAIETIVYYESTPGDPTTIKVARTTSDPFSGRTKPNSFDTAGGSCSISGVNYAFSKVVALPSGRLQFARIKMLYNTVINHEIGVDVNFPGNSSLPSQGQDIDSTGVAGGSNRRISVFQSWPEIPSIFEYSIYSYGSGGLTK